MEMSYEETTGLIFWMADPATMPCTVTGATMSYGEAPAQTG